MYEKKCLCNDKISDIADIFQLIEWREE